MRKHRALPLCLSLWLAVIPLAAPAVPSSLGDHIEALELAPAVSRAAFVEAATDELMSAYRAAAAGADDDAWVRSLRAYVGDLGAAADAARQGAEVRFATEPDGTLRVIVGSRPARQFMLTAPRPDERYRLEQSVLARYCDMTGCPSISPATPEPAAVTIGRAATPALASASRTRIPVGDDGLRCAHDAVRHRRLYEEACAALLQDVRSLAATVHALVREGVVLDWTALARGRARESRLLIIDTPAGARVLTLPALAQVPAFMADIAPWLRARLAGEVRVLALKPPERLIYSLPVARSLEGGEGYVHALIPR